MQNTIPNPAKPEPKRVVFFHAKSPKLRDKENVKYFSLRKLCVLVPIFRDEFFLSIEQRFYLLKTKIDLCILRKSISIIFLILALLFTSSASAKGLLQNIQDDYAKGEISYSQFLVYRMLSLYDQEKLPEKYQGLPLEPVKSSTFLRGELRANWDKLSSAEKALVEPYLIRPALSDSLNSPSGRFKIHYTTTGSNKTTVDFATETAHTFDYCYQLEVEELGYHPPPPDLGVDGPEYDVYIIDVPHTEYGSTTPEQTVPDTPRDDWTSWIQVDNDYTHTYTKGLDGMRVTAAHEFFHMIHFGYRMYQESDKFFYEISAVWMEDVAFDDINDYFFYLPGFFQHPSSPFNRLNYGLSVWAHFLTKKYDRAIIRQIWERMPNHESLDAIDGALLDRGSNLANELAEFAVWNCFTGENADTLRFYDEGINYPEVKPTKSLEFSNKLSFTDSCAALVTKYYQVKPKESGVFSVQVDFTDPFIWRYAVLVQPFDGQPWFDISGGNCNTNLGQVQAYSTIWVLPVNIETPSSSSGSSQSPFTVRIERGSSPTPTAGIVSAAPNPFVLSRHSEVELRYRFARSADNVRLFIFNENGLVVCKKELGRRPDGLNRCKWDGRNEHGEKVVSGIYFFSIEGEEFLGPAKFAVIN